MFFLLELFFIMANIFNYSRHIKNYDGIIYCKMVVVPKNVALLDFHNSL